MLSGAACRGAFQLTDGELVSLTRNDKTVCEDAHRTRDVLSSLAECLPDVGTIIAKRETGLSIASIRGGLILETSAPVNIGMLRVALRNEEVVQFDQSGTTAIAAGGTRALWNLATWIEMIETARTIRVCAGADSFTLWARKGKFGMLDKSTPSELAAAVLSANQSGAAVTLSYEEDHDVTADAVHEPLALFEPATPEATEANEWQFDMAGVPTTRPKHTTLKTTGRMLALHTHLQSWGAGQAFEVTVLRDGETPRVIAQGHESNQIRILVDR